MCRQQLNEKRLPLDVDRIAQLVRGGGARARRKVNGDNPLSRRAECARNQRRVRGPPIPMRRLFCRSVDSRMEMLRAAAL